MERDNRIELLSLDWKSKVLPLNESRKKLGAPTMIRTRHLLITNQLLYQMSYKGNVITYINRPEGYL